MSHIEEGKTNLVFRELPSLLRNGTQEALAEHPCIKLLQQAVLLVARKYDGQILPYYYNYWDRQLPTNTGLALHIPVQEGKSAGEALPRGIGLVVDAETGALAFRGDSWGVDPAFYEQLQRAIVQTYTALAHMAVLRQMNYEVRTEQVEGKITITGGTYAA